MVGKRGDIELLPREDDEDDNNSDDELAAALTSQTPRTKYILNIINTKDVGRIKLLKGVGAKKAEAIVNCLCDLDDEYNTLSIFTPARVSNHRMAREHPS